MSLIIRYISIALACLALLLGIQIPNFVDQYQKRVDAQWTEASINIKAFQVIADQLHGGSMQALLQKHEASTDPTFRAEAKAIRNLWERFQLLEREQAAMQKGLISKVGRVLFGGIREIKKATWSQYSFGLILNRAAIWSGLLSVLITLGLYELSILGARQAWRVKQARADRDED
jgi:hypothetical protein